MLGVRWRRSQSRCRRSNCVELKLPLTQRADLEGRNYCTLVGGSIVKPESRDRNFSSCRRHRAECSRSRCKSPPAGWRPASSATRSMSIASSRLLTISAVRLRAAINSARSSWVKLTTGTTQISAASGARQALPSGPRCRASRWRRSLRKSSRACELLPHDQDQIVLNSAPRNRELPVF